MRDLVVGGPQQLAHQHASPKLVGKLLVGKLLWPASMLRRSWSVVAASRLVEPTLRA